MTKINFLPLSSPLVFFLCLVQLSPGHSLICEEISYGTTYMSMSMAANLSNTTHLSECGDYSNSAVAISVQIGEDGARKFAMMINRNLHIALFCSIIENIVIGEALIECTVELFGGSLWMAYWPPP